MVQCTAMVLSVAVFCSVALLCQASPVDWWESQFAREEEKKKLEEVAAHIISELESEMMIQQNGECLRSIFQYRMHAKLSALFEEVEDGDTGETKFRNLLNFTCISSNYSLFISKNGGKFEKAINSAIIYTCDLVNKSYRSSIQKKGEPRCAIPCMVLQNIQNGTVRVDGNQPRLEGDTAEYSCNSGYQLNGTQNRTCGEDGQWSGQEPSCIPLCPELPAPLNGAVNYENREPGAIATYSCKDKYQLVGPERRICVRDQDGIPKWSGKPSVCKTIICSADSLPITNGEYSPNSSLIRAGPGGRRGYGVDTVITYRCTSDHFELQGESSIICLESGEWSHPPPRCVPLKVCRIPRLRTGEGYAKGGVKYGNRKPGDVANYTCERYAELVGPETRTCLEDGTWSGIDPYCIPIICSPDSLPITDGEFSPSGGLIRAGPGGKRGYGVGTVVNYRCTKDRFELRGESSIICQESGEWSHPPPRCVAAKCPELRLSGNPRSVDEIRRQIERDRPINYGELLIKYFFTKKIEGNYDEGSKAYLTCENDWKLMPNSPSVQTCVRNSTTGELYWTDPGICWYKYYIIRPAFTGGTG